MAGLNFARKIPHLMSTVYKGKPCYYRLITPSEVMKKFGGVGLSESSLKQLKPERDIIIHYKGRTEALYLAKVKDFWKSTKTFNNQGRDMQRFVSFREMKKLREQK